MPRRVDNQRTAASKRRGNLSLLLAMIAGMAVAALVGFIFTNVDDGNGTVQSATNSTSQMTATSATTEVAAPATSTTVALQPGALSVGAPKQLSVGVNSVCAIVESGDLYCWGLNDEVLGANGLTDELITRPIRVDAVSEIRSISVGWHACALLNGGAVECWGVGNDGGLGDGRGNFEDSSTALPVRVKGIEDAVLVETENQTSCAIRSDGTVWCWGEGWNYEFGDGDDFVSSEPVQAVGVDNAVDLERGWYHTCALIADGTVECWGSNSAGQVGNGTRRKDAKTATVVQDLTGVTALSAGDSSTCALLSDQTVACWGDNDLGQLGTGTQASSILPVIVKGLANVTAITSGEGHSCALASSGRVFCWGWNADGQLGNGQISEWRSPNSTPVEVLGLSDVVAIDATGRTTCAATSNGSVYCWGFNRTGMLGAGSSTTSPPFGVPFPTRVLLDDPLRGAAES